jgi:EmrB/QacA subfamily drug resistance transporter
MTAPFAGPCDRGIAASTRACGHEHPRMTLAATILGSCMAFIDGSVVNVALPALQRDLGASPAALPWTINAYLLPLGALILIGGGAGDHFGRRRLFMIGLATLALASALCAAAPSLPWLLGGRGLQGIGAALLMPNSLAILGATFTGERRGWAIGTWAAVGALAGAIGPLIGGWLVDAVGWRMIFLLNLPIAASAGYLSWAYVSESRDTHRTAPLDWSGAALATAALGLLAWSLTAASGAGAASGLIWAAASAGGALLGAFVWLEARRGDHAIMPLSMFATAGFVGLTLFTFFLYGSLGGLLVLLPFLLIKVAGLQAVTAGAALLPVPILVGLGSPLMGGLTGRYGGRWPLTIGATVVASGFAVLSRIGTGSINYWTGILPATILVGIGLAVCVAPLTTTVMASVEADHVGTASGLNSAVARIAGLVATSLLGFVFALQDSAVAFVAAFRMAALIGAAAAVIGAACALLLIRTAARAVPGTLPDTVD